MKRFPIVVLLVVFAFPTIAGAKAKAKKKKASPPCAASLEVCPDEGCGGDFDPKLNTRKNLTSSSHAPQLRTLEWMKNREDPQVWFKGKSRTELIGFGEGQHVTVVAFLLVAKPEGAESCNCRLTGIPNTDNHLVLVSEDTLRKRTLHNRELQSVTAEFTPRVRQDGHPNWKRSKLQPLVDAAPKHALKVRISGLVMFDSEHFIHNPLVRITNWELHPILGFEFCTTGHSCTEDGDDGWQKLDDLE
jgi:hypothetical protein